MTERQALRIGVCETAEEIRATFPVMRQLRPHLVQADYLTAVQAVQQGGGVLIGAWQGEACLGCAVFRLQTRLVSGTILYVDDLVVADEARGQGLGKQLVAWLEAEARSHKASHLVLDSGTQRIKAHRFYFREGFAITSFNFKKSLH